MDNSTTLQVAILQQDLAWENPAKNRVSFEKEIQKLAKNVDLIILPEMFTTGFTMNAKLFAEKMDGETVIWMQQIAANKNAAVVGSIIIYENNNYYNRLLFVHPSGTIESYDKRHAFTLAGEDEVFTSGTEKLLVMYKGWKICPLICYDLRFPVWSRNTENYDLLIYTASWPKPRITAWNALLQARAIENMSYTIGVNRIGTDTNGYEYNGNSAIYDCLGNVIQQYSDGKIIAETTTLHKENQDTIREKLSFLNDKDSFSIELG